MSEVKQTIHTLPWLLKETDLVENDNETCVFGTIKAAIFAQAEKGS